MVTRVRFPLGLLQSTINYLYLRQSIMKDVLYDVVNEKDEIVGKATRTEIIKKGLYRRIVHVLLFDKDGRFLIIQRPSSDKAYPNQWTSSVMGHLELGEQFEEAASRELKEELGISANLTLIGKFPDVSIRDGIEHKVVYGLFVGSVENIAGLELDSNEAQAMKWMDIDAIEEDIKVNSENYAIPFQKNLHYYLQHR